MDGASDQDDRPAPIDGLDLSRVPAAHRPFLVRREPLWRIVNGVWLPTEDVQSLPLGGHALADFMLQRGMLAHTQAELDQLRAQLDQARRPTAKEIIAAYYRERAIWPKLKFAKYLRRIGQSHRERYLRKVKVEYDQQHERGKKG
jgi:hypothetical protein